MHKTTTTSTLHAAFSQPVILRVPVAGFLDPGCVLWDVVIPSTVTYGLTGHGAHSECTTPPLHVIGTSIGAFPKFALRCSHPPLRPPLEAPPLPAATFNDVGYS
ncbi:hypothetical protein FRC03_011074 [Tulasnella sp. 419]|nr:hypothetical protein FRC03_011074 [Tulasnella sp. 419]